MGAVAPYIDHEPDCGRSDWAVGDAVKYEDGLTATASDWPNGIDHETGEDIAESSRAAAARTRIALAVGGSRSARGSDLP